VEGILQNVAFMPGQRVEAGELLLEIEPDQYRAALASAQAGLAQAEAVAGNAQRTLERNTALARQQSVSRAVLDDTQAAAEIAAADVAAARARLNVAELNLSYTRIEAPVAGEIGRVLFTRGNVVSPSSGTLARIVQLDPIRVVFSVSEAEMVTFRQQEGVNGPLDPRTLRLSLRLPNGTTYEQTGQVEYMASEVNPQTGTVPVRTIFANPGRVLVPNQSVNLSVLEETGVELPVVPQSAVLQDREGRFVFVVNTDNTVAMRRIVTSERVQSGWAVTEGLAGGERVVVQGTQRLSDGAEVAPVEGQPLGTQP
jgi:membrane fusion protein (multidrug efflux system)